jgi:hypothetical protein
LVSTFVAFAEWCLYCEVLRQFVDFWEEIAHQYVAAFVSDIFPRHSTITATIQSALSAEFRVIAVVFRPVGLHFAPQ